MPKLGPDFELAPHLALPEGVRVGALLIVGWALGLFVGSTVGFLVGKRVGLKLIVGVWVGEVVGVWVGC